VSGFRGRYTAIAGVVAAVVVVAATSFYSTLVAGSRKSACGANMHQLAIGVRLYQREHGKPPESLEKLLHPDYVGDRRLFVCPSDRVAPEADATGGSFYCSYTYDPAVAASGNPNGIMIACSHHGILSRRIVVICGNGSTRICGTDEARILSQASAKSDESRVGK
jgi:hypothetical protein